MRARRSPRGAAPASSGCRARSAPGRQRTLERTAEATSHISDLQFTESYRVPFQFSPRVRAALPAGSFVAQSAGVQVTDLDGNARYDLTGSYGVNLLGYDFYKGCMERGAARVAELGPVLGHYPSLVADNAARLARISGKAEVSFHMSGTEAVMQAVRLARYHTGRSHAVVFCGAYHGWWGDVQPGVGNPVPAHETYTLADMSERTLAVLRSRRDIACVLVNPVQAMYPNSGAPADSTLVASRPDKSVDRAAYAAWLRALRAVCSERGIVLIFDEVFLGFRVALGGAQEYFGVAADIVTYGKTVGGGFPIGVVCGDHRFMKRFRQDRPADICFARGTFNSHPYVMAAMNEFLLHLETPEMQAALPRSRRDLAAARRLAQPAAGRARPAHHDRPSLVGLDGLLHRLVALQLDVPVLPQGSGPGARLDRHRPADLQPQLQRRRLRGGGRPLPRRRRGDAPRRLVGAGRARHRQGHQAAHPARDAGAIRASPWLPGKQPVRLSSIVLLASEYRWARGRAQSWNPPATSLSLPRRPRAV